MRRHDTRAQPSLRAVGLAVKDNRMATSSMRNHTLRLHGLRLGEWKVELSLPISFAQRRKLKTPTRFSLAGRPQKIKAVAADFSPNPAELTIADTTEKAGEPLRKSNRRLAQRASKAEASESKDAKIELLTIL